MTENKKFNMGVVQTICRQSYRALQAKISGLKGIYVEGAGDGINVALSLEFESQEALEKSGDIMPILEASVKRPETLPGLPIRKRVISSSITAG